MGKEEAEAKEAEDVAAKAQAMLDEAKQLGDMKLAARRAMILHELMEVAAKERAEADEASENRGRATGGLLEDLSDAFRALGQVEIDEKMTDKAEETGRQDLQLQESLYGKD